MTVVMPSWLIESLPFVLPIVLTFGVFTWATFSERCTVVDQLLAAGLVLAGLGFSIGWVAARTF